ncbi:neuroglian-like isoform X4 [Haliotis rufescens]|uniref:neuroglian-like isoform X4 n=1 Tax=Haliotis rufescens TaxID=6454 RepID=UPI001EB0513A|nr:neuroglian-like isoform X4 [Haliotis rufescens]
MGPGLPPALVLVVLSTGLAIATESLSNPNSKPPSVARATHRNVYYLAEEKIELGCIAEGSPEPVYYWLRNGIRMNLSIPENKARMTLQSNVGTLVIDQARTTDEGVYQCVAENIFGKSISIKRNVQLARMDPFPTTVPQKKRALLGRSEILTCRPPNSIPRAKISWIIVSEGDLDYRDEDSEEGFNFVNLDNRITMDWKGNLYITNVKPEDGQEGAKYVCMANNKIVRSFNQGEDKILEPFGKDGEKEPADEPVSLLWHSTLDVLGLVGKTAKFKCIFAGNPQVKIVWKRKGKELTSRMSQSRDMFDLEIKRVKYEDAGLYVCEGSNTAHDKVIKKTFNLTVEARPKWVLEPKDLTVGVEENAAFSCEAKGSPQPTVQWYINGNQIELEPPNPRRRLQGNKLIFTNLSKSDSQVIQCNATNKNGFMWADVFLHVLAIPANVDREPLPRLKVAEGQTITLTCESSGKPKPSVVWFKGNQPLTGDRHVVQDNGDLLIKNVNHKDTGNYKCYARNRFGKDEANGTLTVRKKTKIDSEPLDLELIYGNEATFTCGAITDPLETLEYSWLRNGVRIEEDDPRFSIMDGTLTIIDINSKDTANYTCMASNGLDNATASAKLQVKAPPDPPYNVSMKHCYANDAILKWQFDTKLENFSPLQSFIVEYNTSFHPDVWVTGARPSADSREAEIKLSLWVRYNFRVKAINEIGIGKPSAINPAECKTPQGRPDRHPRKVQTVGDKTNFLVIEWEPMPQIEHNAPDFFYNITVKEEDGDGVMNFAEADSTVGRREIFINKTYKPYKIIVRAQNRVGQPYLPAEEIRGFSGEAAPTVVPGNFELDPDKNVTATSAGFRWDPVNTSTESMQGEYKGYKVRYWKREQKETTLHEVFIPDTTKDGASRRRRQADNKMRAEVRNLPSYSEIEADVVVVNNYFSSEGSNIVNFSTPEGVPSAVEYLDALYRGSTHFLLEWGEPKEPNGNVTGYRVGYKKIQGLEVGELVVGKTVTKRRVFLGGLSPDTAYRVYVWGLTQEGQGEEYYIDTRTAEHTSDLVRPVVDKVMAAATAVNVTWRIPDIDGRPVGARSFLQYRQLGKGDWDSVPDEEHEDFWQQIEGLKEATPYQVRVVTKTGQYGTESYREAASDQRTFTTTGVAAKRANVLSAGWFIGMMVAIAILLLILIIVCIIKRNRGDKYHVQEKERLRGSNPDDGQDHFNEYAKSDENGVGQSNSFENNPEKMPLEYDETDSMEDYGDVDPGKFNEDGSFIGQYGVQKSPEPANASAMSTLV